VARQALIARGAAALATVLVASAALALPGAASHGRAGVGDSIMLSARQPLAAAGVRPVDAVVGRQFVAGVGVVRDLARRDALPRNLVVHLGTNGPFATTQCRRLVRLAGPEHRVFLVTVRVPRWWAEDVNAALRTCASAFAPGRVVLVPWHTASRGRSAWFAPDGYHLSARGTLAYAQLVDDVLDERALAKRAASAAIASGPVPQQPPTSRAPLPSHAGS
jgi:hypothetical protein